MKRKLLSMILAVTLAANLAVSVSAGDIDVMMSDDTVNENAVSEDIDQGITFDGEASDEDGTADAEVEMEENADEETDPEGEDTVEEDFADSEIDVFSDGAPEAGVNGHAVVGGYIPSDLDYNTPVYNGNDDARAVGVPAAYQSNINKYPEAKNQGSYGTCSAFSTMGLAEFDMINKGKFTKANDLSELQLAYFTYNFVQDPLGGTAGDTAHYYNENASVNYLNYGGNYEMAVQRLGQWIGAVNESDVHMEMMEIY